MSNLRSELLAVKKKYGKLNANTVLKEALEKGSALSRRTPSWFKDDKAAAHRARLEWAQNLIMKVSISYTNRAGEPREVRAFYAVRASDRDQYDYEATEEILADPFKRKLLLNDMQRRIDELVASYEEVPEFWDYLKGISRTKKAVKK